MTAKKAKSEFGDYQTPADFALEVFKFLKEERKLQPQVIIEPTCGVGGFVKGSLMFEVRHILGVEINPDYCAQCKSSITAPRVQIVNEDFFAFDVKAALPELDHVLALGNPPWVTTSTLSTLYSSNLPTKSNFKGLKGLDALTGAVTLISAKILSSSWPPPCKGRMQLSPCYARPLWPVMSFKSSSELPPLKEVVASREVYSLIRRALFS